MLRDKPGKYAKNRDRKDHEENYKDGLVPSGQALYGHSEKECRHPVNQRDEQRQYAERVA
jgi:hypothetical protein